jgi:hypothetical protein
MGNAEICCSRSPFYLSSHPNSMILPDDGVAVSEKCAHILMVCSAIFPSCSLPSNKIMLLGGI